MQNSHKLQLGKRFPKVCKFLMVMICILCAWLVAWEVMFFLIIYAILHIVGPACLSCCASSAYSSVNSKVYHYKIIWADWDILPSLAIFVVSSSIWSIFFICMHQTIRYPSKSDWNFHHFLCPYFWIELLLLLLSIKTLIEDLVMHWTAGHCIRFQNMQATSQIKAFIFSSWDFRYYIRLIYFFVQTYTESCSRILIQLKNYAILQFSKLLSSTEVQDSVPYFLDHFSLLYNLVWCSNFL